MECKMAYQLLIDPVKRKQYDRQHQVWSSGVPKLIQAHKSCQIYALQLLQLQTLPPQGGFDWGDFVDGIAGGGAKQRKQDTGEPFYGFTDFLRDLDVDLKRWSDQVNKKGAINF